MAIVFNNTEFNIPSEVVASVTFNNCIYSSDSADSLPDIFLSSEYSKNNFVYNDYSFTVTPLGSVFWTSNSYTTGIGGISRDGVGAFYFYIPVPNPDAIPYIVDSAPCVEPAIESRNLWSYLTTFWDLLTEKDIDIFENYWHGIVIAGHSLIKKARRFYELLAPQNSRTCVFDDYYDIQIGPLYSKPMNLDPTLKVPNYIIVPIDKLFIEPDISSGSRVYSDLIELTASDYNKSRNVAIDNYVVIKVKKDGISDKSFKITNLLSSTESNDQLDYAEIDQEQNEDGDDVLIGTMAIQGLLLPNAVGYEDISEKTVDVIDGVAAATTIVFTADSVVITVKTDTGNQLDSIINATATGTTPWCTFTKKASTLQTNVAIFDGTPIQVRDLSNYIKGSVKSDRYYNPTGLTWKWFGDYTVSDGSVGDTIYGEWKNDISTFKYFMEVEGDLSYIGDESFSIYITTGRSYDVDKYIESIPTLQTFINNEDSPEFILDVDYSFNNHIVEFFKNIFETSQIEFDQHLYNPKTPIIEHMLFETYGTMVNNSNWLNYNYDNTGGKAAINSLIYSLQNSSKREDYERALNVYYGMPVAPEDCEVAGLYESYGYEVLSITNDIVELSKASDQDLHKFVQNGGRMGIEGKRDFIIKDIVSRSSGTLKFYDTSSEIAVGDKMNLKLKNKFIIKDIVAETSTVNGYVDIYSPEGYEAIQHIIDVINTTSNGNIWPEMIIYGTGELDNNYDGIYHIVEAANVSGKGTSVVRLKVYKPSDSGDTLYNDYIGTTNLDIKAGFVHIPWPTHKYLYLAINDSKYFKAYLDAPIDTIFDEEDNLSQYQTIARNVSALTKVMFPDWYQFDLFRKFHGLNYESDILELTKSIPGAKFGEYFPSGYDDIN